MFVSGSIILFHDVILCRQIQDISAEDTAQRLENRLSAHFLAKLMPYQRVGSVLQRL